jgi:hypothetical protein
VPGAFEKYLRSMAQRCIDDGSDVDSGPDGVSSSGSRGQLGDGDDSSSPGGDGGGGGGGAGATSSSRKRKVVWGRYHLHADEVRGVACLEAWQTAVAVAARSVAVAVGVRWCWWWRRRQQWR